MNRIRAGLMKVTRWEHSRAPGEFTPVWAAILTAIDGETLYRIIGTFAIETKKVQVSFWWETNCMVWEKNFFLSFQYCNYLVQFFVFYALELSRFHRIIFLLCLSNTTTEMCITSSFYVRFLCFLLLQCNISLIHYHFCKYTWKWHNSLLSHLCRYDMFLTRPVLLKVLYFII